MHSGCDAMKPNRLLAVGAGLLACIIWASSFVVINLEATITG